ncbi:uncharacterized protein I303_105734 [Kwoniella dejecticola CBS 10117]|uniref:Transcription factor domain-containing protein n=1 Tax=Kwoniella dejecticola CBS 10117 TaxID=1296121 RepID=A0A1A6A090_9TREE|nr:uncharacterized protein I303_05756 [Kwoniella dejecticola CBS 10117]OBR83477.1 hypothetical protein I303_05756 [Kwoniella dejecticola CBS 10117]
MTPFDQNDSLAGPTPESSELTAALPPYAEVSQASTETGDVWMADGMHTPDSIIRATQPDADLTGQCQPPDIASANDQENGLHAQQVEPTSDFLPFPSSSGYDIWQLLAQESLPDSHSLHASPEFLAQLGLDSNPFLHSTSINSEPLHDKGREGHTEERRDSSETEHFFLDRSSFEGPSLASSGVNAEERGEYILSATSTMMARMTSNIPSEVSPLTSDFLGLCMNMFWTRIWPTCPIIHPSTFNMRQTSAPLLMNMIALGSLASQKRSLQVKGTSLWTLVNRSITLSWHQLIENRAQHDPCNGRQLIQTLALGLLFASVSASPHIINAAGLSVANGFRWLQLSGQTDGSNIHRQLIPAPEEHLSSSDLDSRWRQWAVLEDLKRAQCMIYQGDCELSNLSSLPPTGRPLSLGIGGMCDDEATYLAPNPAAWRRAAEAFHAKVPSVLLRPTNQLYHHFFNTDTSLDKDLALLPMMARVILLDGLNAFINEYPHLTHVPDFGLADLGAIDLALARYHTILLDQTVDPRSKSVLISRWHEVCIVLGRVKAEEKGLSGLNLWESSLGRHMLLHANAIRQSVENIRIGRNKVPSPTHVQSTYVAALVIRDYVNVKKERSWQGASTSFSLNREEDWEELNNSVGVSCSNLTFAPQSYPVTVVTGKDFILYSGVPFLNGLPLGIHDIDPLITVLAGLGRTYPRAEQLAAQLDDQYM